MGKSDNDEADGVAIPEDPIQGNVKNAKKEKARKSSPTSDSSSSSSSGSDSDSDSSSSSGSSSDEQAEDTSKKRAEGSEKPSSKISSEKEPSLKDDQKEEREPSIKEEIVSPECSPRNTKKRSERSRSASISKKTKTKEDRRRVEQSRSKSPDVSRQPKEKEDRRRVEKSRSRSPAAYKKPMAREDRRRVEQVRSRSPDTRHRRSPVAPRSSTKRRSRSREHKSRERSNRHRSKTPERHRSKSPDRHRPKNLSSSRDPEKHSGKSRRSADRSLNRSLETGRHSASGAKHSRDVKASSPKMWPSRKPKDEPKSDDNDSSPERAPATDKKKCDTPPSDKGKRKRSSSPSTRRGAERQSSPVHKRPRHEPDSHSKRDRRNRSRSVERRRSRSVERRRRSPPKESRDVCSSRQRDERASPIRRRERDTGKDERPKEKSSRWEKSPRDLKREAESPPSMLDKFGLEKRAKRDSEGDKRGSQLMKGKGEKERWGKPEMWAEEEKKKDEPPVEKEKVNMEVSGKLAEDTNTFRGVVIKYNEPAEAKKPTMRWRLYPFKGDDALPALYIHRQSAYLVGRDRKVADIAVDHPSCSKQHAAIQYRSITFEREDGSKGKRVLPYIIDLGSSNGTVLNGTRIEPQRYVELQEKDVIKFGFSSREFVILNESSAEGDGSDKEMPSDRSE